MRSGVEGTLFTLGALLHTNRILPPPMEDGFGSRDQAVESFTLLLSGCDLYSFKV